MSVERKERISYSTTASFVCLCFYIPFFSSFFMLLFLCLNKYNIISQGGENRIYICNIYKVYVCVCIGVDLCKLCLRALRSSHELIVFGFYSIVGGVLFNCQRELFTMPLDCATGDCHGTRIFYNICRQNRFYFGNVQTWMILELLKEARTMTS